MLTHDEDKEHFTHYNICEHAVLNNHYNPTLLSDSTESKVLTPQVQPLYGKKHFKLFG
ncbi:hypothetical protein [Leeuwenhoekiella marinoflava]|uniref:hypothetical protein n=1 Tax=Leeuwenhoekiella marinoflava TaxID=988 RepID=UPI00300134DE